VWGAKRVDERRIEEGIVEGMTPKVREVGVMK